MDAVPGLSALAAVITFLTPADGLTLPNYTLKSVVLVSGGSKEGNSRSKWGAGKVKIKKEKKEKKGKLYKLTGLNVPE